MLHYDDEGEGPLVVLLHGFAADSNINFVRSGIFDTLADAGYRVVAFDARGHGLSEKPTEPVRYTREAIRHDVQALLDHLGAESCVLVGFSMGGHTAIHVTSVDPRVQALVLLGVGSFGIDDDASGRGRDRRRQMLAALEGRMDEVHDEDLREFPLTAGMDRAPLIAYTTGRLADDPEPFPTVAVPVLMVVGTEDTEAGDPAPVAALLHAELRRVPGTHFKANAKPELHAAVLAFLAAR
jgi:pimeloyl-ACP methyl ester carboxylesterase